jgi:hypothetical protein
LRTVYIQFLEKEYPPGLIIAREQLAAEQQKERGILKPNANSDVEESV